MPGINTKGVPSTDDYHLGRGRLYIAELDENGLPLAYRELGNAPEFGLTLEVETLEHRSSLEGLKTVDKEVVISLDATVNFTLDELSFQNLALFLAGVTAAYTNPSIATAAVDVVIAAANTWSKGMWYDLKSAAGNRYYDIDADDLDVETHDGSTGTPLTAGTDYIVDEVMGRIFIPDTSTAVVTSALRFDLALNAAAEPVDELRALTTTTKIVALKFISENAAFEDHRIELQVHKISLKSDGDLNLIADEFGTMAMTGKAERNGNAAFANSPTMTLRTFAGAKAA